jgi:hypothetical protein
VAIFAGLHMTSERISDELARIRERLEQNRQLRQSQIRDRLATAVPAAALSAAPFLPGDRVFDTVTGLEGEVIARTAENIIVPTANR